jgi:hypothetical protein
MKIAIIPLLFLATLISLYAQDQDSSAQLMPTGPLLNRVSPPSQWIITTQVAPSQPGSGASGSVSPAVTGTSTKPAKPRVTSVTKNEDIIYEKIITEDGDVLETWRAAGCAVTRTDGKDLSVSPGVGNTFNATDYSKSDFAGFDWISLSNFSGRQSVLGKKCLIFKSKVVIMDPQQLQMEKLATHLPGNASVSDNQFKVDVEADIDDQSRLPVLLTYQTTHGEMTRSYTFQTPDGSLSMPPEVQQLLNKYIRIQKRMAVPIAPI